jgi:hypothetical protein
VLFNFHADVTSKSLRAFEGVKDNKCQKSDQKWLASSRTLLHSDHMSLGRQASRPNQSKLATGRYDRESKAGSGLESHGAAASGFSWAALLEIPLGYEDDMGFHCGEPQGKMIVPEDGSKANGNLDARF